MLQMKGLSKGLLMGLLVLVLSGCGPDESGPESADRSVAPAASVAALAGVPEYRPSFVLPDMDGVERTIEEWDGQVVLLNFWAPWCPPCVREMPAFMELQDDYAEHGFSVVAVAIDTLQNVIDFVDPLGIEFPILMGTDDGIAIAREYGNRVGALPYTVIYDRQGRIVYTHRNEMTYAEAAEVIEPLLHDLPVSSAN